MQIPPNGSKGLKDCKPQTNPAPCEMSCVDALRKWNQASEVAQSDCTKALLPCCVPELEFELELIRFHLTNVELPSKCMA